MKDAEILRRVGVEVQTLPSQVPPTIDPRVAELEAVLAKERAEWAEEREKLKQSVSMLETSRSNLRSESDFLREEYRKASGAAASLRSENIDLEKRATLAESQATQGVALVRGTFEVRVKRLEEDLGRAKALNHILIEKERRTDDSIRWKAALHDEIERENVILTRKGELLEAEIDELKEEIRSVKRENEKMDRYMQKVKAKRLKKVQSQAGMSDKTKGKQKADGDVLAKESNHSGDPSTRGIEEIGSGSTDASKMRGSERGLARRPTPVWSDDNDQDQRGDGGDGAGDDLQQQPVRVHVDLQARIQVDKYSCSWRSLEKRRVCRFVAPSNRVRLLSYKRAAHNTASSTAFFVLDTSLASSPCNL